MDPQGGATLTHIVTNLAQNSITVAPWALTVLAENGLEIIPQNTEDTGLLPNRRIVAWPYTDLTDKRLFLGKEFITLKADTEVDCACKLGLDLHDGTALYVIGDTVFTKKYSHVKDGNYTDFGVSFETYTLRFLEIETLGELIALAENESVAHTEQWKLGKTDAMPDPRNEAQLREFVKKYR